MKPSECIHGYDMCPIKTGGIPCCTNGIEFVENCDGHKRLKWLYHVSGNAGFASRNLRILLDMAVDRGFPEWFTRDMKKYLDSMDKMQQGCPK